MRKALVPLFVFAGLCGVGVYMAYNDHQDRLKAQAHHQALMASHNPDEFQRPVCVSRDTGWGVVMLGNSEWYIADPDMTDLQKMIGHWSTYPQLRNLACREQV